MKERPILFSSEMVRAILAGRKTQTRRVLKPYPCGYEPSLNKDGLWEFCCESHFENDEPKIHIFKCPYGKIGDQLWVRETFWIDCNNNCHYRAGEENDISRNEKIERYKSENWKWKPSIFMPRWASRIQLEITDIRVERVQEITTAECWKEGINQGLKLQKAFNAFSELWNSINAKRGYSWESNPWVWVIEFKRRKP